MLKPPFRFRTCISTHAPPSDLRGGSLFRLACPAMFLHWTEILDISDRDIPVYRNILTLAAAGATPPAPDFLPGLQ